MSRPKEKRKNKTIDRCDCGHREYDHITSDGSCFKCDCHDFNPPEEKQ